ncbi:hypothetical protein D770_16540 [Flammeovirgaceae bacterium 311]|nr:hypothetical protein D770_16540 [Flammeovirgaceae bacterium 311]
MKKMLVATLVAMLGITSAYGQFSAGTLSVGGGVAFSSEKSKYEYDNNRTVEGDLGTYFKLSPSVGYFFADDLEAGLTLGITRQAWSSSFNSDLRYITGQTTFEPYVRKYFSLAETVAFFGEAGLGIGGGKTTRIDDDNNTTVKYNQASVFNLGLRPGVVFRPADRFGVELTAGYFGYRSTRTENPDNNGDVDMRKDSSFGLSLDMSNVQLGLKLFF